MNTYFTNRSIFAAVLLGWAGASSALSIGPATGPTVVGRPLELSVPIQFDELAEGARAGCVGAELLYGDKAVDRSKVQLSLVHDEDRQMPVARISSLAILDEPVVTLIVWAGCGRQISRRFVLLAEAPRDEPMVLGASSSLALASAGGSSVLAGMNPTQVSSPARIRGVRTVAVTSPAIPQVARRVAMEKVGAGSRQEARLQLAVWEPRSEQSPWLRASVELRSTPSADAAHRAAATALWRALNAQPQDLLRTADRLRGLEGEVSSLRSLAARHRSEISSARESLQIAQTQRYSNLLLAACLALLAGGGAAFFWHRSRQSRALTPYTSWNPRLEPEGDPVVEDRQEPAAVFPVQVAETPVARPGPPRVVVAPESAARQPLEQPLEFTLPEITAAARGAVHFDERRPGLKVEALHAAQQQSEFFASLGQFDEAVAVLSAYIDESAEKPVLAFLELFRIFHASGMRVEYEELQSKFRQTFGVDTASFSQYKDERRELEMYPVAVTRISSRWGTAEGQEVIEELLFKRPSGPRDLLSLDACSELVWLYSLGQNIIHSTGVPAGLQLLEDGGLPNNHFIMPWDAAHQDGLGDLSLDRLKSIDVATGSNAFGVDIDLTAMPGEALQQSWHDERKQPEPATAKAAAAKPQDSSDAASLFDAVMESESRKLFR